MHVRRLSNLLSSRMKNTVTTVNAARQNCSPNDANIIDPQDVLHQHTLRAAYQAFVWRQCLHRAQRCPSPSTCWWPRTKDNHGSQYGQHFVRLRIRATSRSTVASNKTVKQDASVQLSASHVLGWIKYNFIVIVTALCYGGGDCNEDLLDDSICMFQPTLWELLQLHFCSRYAFNQSCLNTGLQLVNW